MRVPYRVVSAALGAGPLTVWRVLVWFRDETQAVFPGLTFLGGKAGLSVRTTQRALARLRAVGLVIDRGSIAELGARGFTTPFHRTVLGREVRGGFDLPESTLTSMRQLGAVGSHGGRRAGAGRRVKAVASPIQVARPVLSESCMVARASVNQVAPSLPRLIAEVGLPEWTSPRPVISGLRESSGALVSTTTATMAFAVPPFGRYVASSARAQLSPLTGNAALMALKPSSGVSWLQAGQSPPPAAINAGEALLDAVAQLRADLSGVSRRRVAWGEGGLPPFPAPEETHVKVPGPPRVPEHLVDGQPADTPAMHLKLRREQLDWCAEWYDAVMRSRGVGAHRIRMAGQTKGYFEDALEVWTEHDIRPAAWIAWNLDRILSAMPTNARRRFSPRVMQMLSPKTLTEHRWMFRESEAVYAPRLVPSKAGERLMLTLNELWLYALRHDEAQVRMAVDAAFPEGYAKRRREVCEKTEAVRQGVLDRIREFEWVWTVPPQGE